MAFKIYLWTDELIDHLAQHGLTADDFEAVVSDPNELTRSRSSGRSAAIGYDVDGRKINCIDEEIDDLYVDPFTAYEIEDCPMQLTPEQRAQADQAQRAGQQRVFLTPTDEQRAEKQRAIAEEEAARDEIVAAYARRRQAEAEPGLAGDLRRAITAARRPQLAAEIGVDAGLLEDFREGHAVLPFEAVDRLVTLLGLRLMAEIRA
jgi:ribosome-binding protein aMBF1 (putative translation factor)